GIPLQSVILCFRIVITIIKNNQQYLIMKKFGTTICLLLFFALASCKGDRGPAGINILGQVFETTVNFNSGNNFSAFINFPNNVEVFESDAVLVYLLEEVDGDVDVWTPLPQTYFTE